MNERPTFASLLDFFEDYWKKMTNEDNTKVIVSRPPRDPEVSKIADLGILAYAHLFLDF